MGRKVDQNGAGAHTGIPARNYEMWRVRGGGPPYYKLGRRVVYDTDELDEWMRSKRRTSTSDAEAEQ
jgi:hypothetical protein